jgi:hypothetical protein
MTTPKKREIDMSPAALAGRLEELRALYKLAEYLRGARLIGPVENSSKPSR